MPNLEEVKLIVLPIVKSCPFGEIQLLDLEKEFRSREGESLKVVAGELGFDGISSMVKSWPELAVFGSGLNTKVRSLETNHITELNSRTKKSGNKNRGVLTSDDCSPRPFHGKDPNAFSSDDDDNYNSMFAFDDMKAKSLEALVEPAGPEINKVTKAVVPGPITLQDFSQTLIVALTDSINPHRFWFTPYDDYKKLNVLTEKMNAFYSSSESNKLKVNPADMQEGLCVAAKFNSLWNRGKIVGKFGEVVRIFYVDFGTVEDVVAEGRIRFLREDFAKFPAFALRGVLSHVQPVDGTWSEDCKEFFMKKLYKQKLEVKVFKHNAKDSSYAMAIKAVIDEDKTRKLVSDALIIKGFCISDYNFLDKTIVNEAEGEFSEYEAGKFLKKPKVKEPEESWLPSPVSEKVEAKKSAKSSGTESTFKTVYKPLKIPTGSSSDSSKENSPTKSLEVEKTSHVASNSSAKSTAGTSDTLKGTLCEQNLSDLKVGEVVKVYVHVVNALDNFYFYLKKDFMETRSYLKIFNDVYKDIDVPKNLAKNEEFTVGNFVAIKADENFCRGKIIEELGVGEMYKIFLVDFGFVVDRRKEEIFTLFEDFMRKQAAVYLGRLANIPEHVHIKTKEQFLEKVSGKLVSVKILRVDGDCAEILLIDQ